MGPSLAHGADSDGPPLRPECRARRPGHPCPVTEPLDLFAGDTGPPPDLETIREQAAACTRCELYRDTTQTVFGVGPTTARLVMVGEQPGDQEDRQGAPFVGPAGRLLDEALDEAGIARDD